MSPKKELFQREIHLPTIDSQGLCYFSGEYHLCEWRKRPCYPSMILWAIIVCLGLTCKLNHTTIPASIGSEAFRRIPISQTGKHPPENLTHRPWSSWWLEFPVLFWGELPLFRGELLRAHLMDPGPQGSENLCPPAVCWKLSWKMLERPSCTKKCHVGNAWDF